MFHCIVLYEVDQDCRETLLRFEKLVIDMRHCLHFASMVLMNGYSWTVDSSTLTIVKSKKIPKWFTFRFFSYLHHFFYLALDKFEILTRFNYTLEYYFKKRTKINSLQLKYWNTDWIFQFFCFRSKLYTSKINICFLII